MDLTLRPALENLTVVGEVRGADALRLIQELSSEYRKEPTAAPESDLNESEEVGD